MTRRTTALCVAILLVAIGARVAVHFELRDYVLYEVPLVDAQDYVEWATRLVRGQGEAADVYYKAPLYPWVLAIFMRIVGPGVAAAYVLNAALGVASVLFLGLWARRLFGTRLALVTAALAAVYGPMLYFEAQALPPPLVILLSLVALLALTSRGAAPSARGLVVAGVTLGLLVLARPSCILWTPVAALWAARQSRPFAWRRAVVVTCVAASVVAPVTLRNFRRGGDWVLVSANGGINFFLGNNADAARTSTLRPGLEWEELVRRIPEAERRGQARWDRWFARRAWSWVRDEPVQFGIGLGRKALEYCNVHEIDRNLDVRGFRSQSHVLRCAPRYAWLAPWLLLGVVVVWRRGPHGQLAVLLAAASLMATALFFVSERYKLDAIAATLPFAVGGCGELVAAIRRRSRLPLAWVVGLCAAGVGLAFPNWLGVRSVQPARAAALQGVALYALGRNVEAIAELQRAVAEEPGDADAHYQLATALRRLDRFDAALASFETAARLVPGNPKPHAGAGLVLRQLNRPVEALERYRDALREDPTNVLLLFETGEILEQLGRRAEAHAQYAAALRIGGDAQLMAELRRRVRRLE